MGGRRVDFRIEVVVENEFPRGRFDEQVVEDAPEGAQLRRLADCQDCGRVFPWKLEAEGGACADAEVERSLL